MTKENARRNKRALRDAAVTFAGAYSSMERYISGSGPAVSLRAGTMSDRSVSTRGEGGCRS